MQKVLRAPKMKDERDPLKLQRVLNEALRAAAADPNFDLEIISSLLTHGAKISNVWLNDLFDKAPTPMRSVLHVIEQRQVQHTLQRGAAFFDASAPTMETPDATPWALEFANMLDGIIVFAVFFVIVAAIGAGLLIGVLIYVVYLWLVVQFGATPGKLALGLRITEEDGTTPVGWRGAFMRSIPDLLGNLPLIGWLIMLGAGIGSIFLINSDAENRSVYDRVGNTRVVRKQAL